MEPDSFSLATSWTRLDSQPQQHREDCGICSYGQDSVIVVGGHGPTSGDVLTSVERFDFSANQWSSLPDLTIERYACTAIAVNDILYVFGGKNRFYRKLDTCEVLNLSDPIGGFRILKKRIPKPQRWRLWAGGIKRARAAHCNNLIYLVGGDRDDEVYQYCGSRSFLSFDTDTQSFRYLRSRRERRHQPAVAILNDTILVVGGFTAWNRALRGRTGIFPSPFVETFHIPSQKWTQRIPSMPSRLLNTLVRYPAFMAEPKAIVFGFAWDDRYFVYGRETGYLLYDSRVSQWKLCNTGVDSKGHLGTVTLVESQRCLVSCKYNGVFRLDILNQIQAGSVAGSSSQSDKSNDRSKVYTRASGIGPVGELSALGSFRNAQHNDTPLLFVSHRGPDTKDAIARPTQWFVSKCLKIPTFFDDESLQAGDPKMPQLVDAAYKCTHALVLLSRTFIQSRYCVQELNTFMARRYDNPDNIRVMLALWNIDSLDLYSESLDELVYLRNRTRTNNPAEYMMETLFPYLSKVLPHEQGAFSRDMLERCLVEYVERNRGETEKSIPSALERFVKRKLEREE